MHILCMLCFLFSLPQWPYCLRRCTYCNFNKYIPKENNEDIMAKCLQRETETLLQLSQVSWYVHSFKSLLGSILHAGYHKCSAEIWLPLQLFIYWQITNWNFIAIFWNFKSCNTKQSIFVKWRDNGLFIKQFPESILCRITSCKSFCNSIDSKNIQSIETIFVHQFSSFATNY